MKIKSRLLLVAAALLGAVVLAVVGRLGWLPRLVGVVLVLPLVAFKVLELVRLIRRGRVVDFRFYPREGLALLLGFGAWQYASAPDELIWILATVAVLGATMWFGRQVPGEVHAPLVLNLPGAPHRRPDPPRIDAFWWPVLLLATLLLSALAGPLVPSWGLLALVLLGVGAMLWVGIPLARYRFSRARTTRALRQFQPEFVMMYAAFNGAQYQLGMWEPYLKASGNRFVIITRDPRTMGPIAEVTDAPVICPLEWTKAGVLDCLPASVQAAFYVQNSRYNDVCLKIKRVTHVWLNHGDSDKPANFNHRHARYDRLVVCGQAGIDRYAAHGIEVSLEQFAVVGRPQVSDIDLVSTSIGDVDVPLVLYAPTWRGLKEEVNFSSLPIGAEFVQALIDRGARVLFRPHPLSYKHKEKVHIDEIQAMLAADTEATGREHIWGRQADTDWSVADCTNASDALISDVSSVVSDYLASGKPYAMVATRWDVETFRREYPIAESAYVIRPGDDSVQLELEEMLTRDPLAASRQERRTYYLGGLSGAEAAQQVADLVDELTDPRAERVAPTSLGA